ncbi:MAG: hypothetical protein ACYDCD_00995 [Candidatus Acidiferrales bacterium]
MAFSDFNKDFVPRMKDPSDLTKEEVCESMDWIAKTPTGIGDMLGMRLSLQEIEALRENTDAIRKFDESSRKLTRWLIGLTVVLVILTIVIAAFTILLWRRG